jgi:hypothetical protein
VLPTYINFYCIVAGHFPPPYFLGPPQLFGPNAGDGRNTSDSKKDIETIKEEKPRDVEKVEPK